RAVERRAPEVPAAGPRISKSVAEAFGLEGKPAATPAAEPERIPTPAKPVPRATVPSAPPAPPEPAPEAPLEVPESGDLAEVSPARLYALSAVTSASGLLELEPEKGGALRIGFRRGVPEHFATDDPDLTLTRFLVSRGALAPEKAQAADAFAQKAGQDVVTVLFQMQLLPPADAHRLLGDHALSLLDRALVTWRGAFRFDKDAALPPGAFPLGARWALLVQALRRLEVAMLRARLGKRLALPVVRSGGLSLGKVEELGLTAQEARLYASIDGTRTGEELIGAHDPAAAVRILYLLTELGHLSFVDLSAEEPKAEPAAAPPPAAAQPGAGPAGSKPAPAPSPRELPRTAREVGRATPASGQPAVAGRGPPPVLQPSAAAAVAPKPAATPAITRPLPTFAQPPAGETAEAALQRLSELWERLSEGDHYSALGMDRKSATPAEAKRNFFALAKELHPDTVTDASNTLLRDVKERLFARINEAAQVLSDEKRRKEYDAELEGKASNVDISRIFAAEENFQRAEILIKAHKYKEGLALLDEAIAMNADEAEFYAWRGYAKFLLATNRKEVFEECAGDCHKAIKMVERCLPAHLFLGQMSKVVGDLKQAKKCFLRVLELDEKHVEAMRELRLMGQKP
ncbi:MAG TPA: DnaJ domain-containing protein, partial [Myxococcales bacterium]|nr:DnaJ domain-containing protein [Myxococcales bacterium]